VTQVWAASRGCGLSSEGAMVVEGGEDLLLWSTIGGGGGECECWGC